MGKKVSDLFAKNGEVTKMVVNDSSLKSSDTNSVSSLTGGVTIPERVDATGAQVDATANTDDPIEIVSNIIRKYQSLTSSPASVMRILTGDFQIDSRKAAEVIKLPEFAKGDIASNGLLSHILGSRAAGKIGGLLDDLGLSSSSLASSIVRTGKWIGGRYTLPMDMHPLDILNLVTSLNSVGVFGDKLDYFIGSRDKIRPRWSMIAPLANSPLALKTLMARFSEGDKMRIGWKLPSHKVYTSDLNRNEAIYQLRSIKSDDPDFDAIIDSGYYNGSVADAGYSSDTSIYGNFKIGDPAIKDYAKWEDYPYDVGADFGTISPSDSAKLFSDRVNDLRDAGLLSGYADWAGFEIGSDHQWKVELYPYVSEEHGNGTCTPELPVFFVPNIWGFTSKDERLVSDTSVRIKSGTEVSNIIAKEYPRSRSPYDGDYDYIAYSYSTCLPALSYDLSLGTIKTDSLKLFNGSTVEVFAGMNYNSILNISILDDVYGSMHKYMFQYINACYDINNHALAPYYNCAFEIVLKILRPGGKLKEAHHFIGVPVEYTPRLEGQQDPNESRLDITFGIIGYITPTNTKAWTDHDGREESVKDKYKLPKTPTWKDISFKAGQQFIEDPPNQKQE